MLLFSIYQWNELAVTLISQHHQQQVQQVGVDGVVICNWHVGTISGALTGWNTAWLIDWLPLCVGKQGRRVTDSRRIGRKGRASVLRRQGLIGKVRPVCAMWMVGSTTAYLKVA